MKQLLYLVTAILITAVASAQNPRLSMFEASPLVLNPALTGKTDAKSRIGTHYSYQSSDIATITHLNAFVDFSGRIQAARKKYNHYGVGFNFYTYGFNSKSPVMASFPSVSFAYHFELGKSGKHFFGVGAQVALAFAKLDEKKGTYDKEISGGGFRYDPTPLRNQTASNDYWDASGGITYLYKTDQLKFETGLAMYHMFYPKNDIYDKDFETRLRHRGVLNMRFEFNVAANRSLVLQSMYWADGLYWRSRVFDSDNLIAFWNGAEIHNIKPKKQVWLNYGFYSRSFRTVMPYASVFFTKQVNLRASYELPINSAIFEAYRSRRAEVAVLFNIYKK